MFRKSVFVSVLILSSIPASSQAFTPPPFKSNEIREGWNAASIDTSWGYSLGFLVPDFGKSLTTTFGCMWALDNKHAIGFQARLPGIHSGVNHRRCGRGPRCGGR